MSTLPTTMKAVVFEAYGGPGQLKLKTVPVPTLAADEVLIEVHAAGVGVWDAMQREGQARSMEPGGGLPLPVVPGADGSGVIVAVGEAVTDLAVDDPVYGYSFLSPKGGFYAEYAAVKAEGVARIPKGLDMDQAAALAVTGITALRGLDDHLHVKPGQRVLIFGASGGVGDPAVQLAKAMGATVMGVVSSQEGAALALHDGADPVVDTKLDELPEALRAFAPHGLDAVLATVNGNGLAAAIAAIRSGGRLAWPHGVDPEPEAGEGVVASAYDGFPDRALLDKLNALIESRQGQHPAFALHVPRIIPLADAQEAHRALQGHHVGRMVLRVR